MSLLLILCAVAFLLAVQYVSMKGVARQDTNCGEMDLRVALVAQFYPQAFSLLGRREYVATSLAIKVCSLDCAEESLQSGNAKIDDVATQAAYLLRRSAGTKPFASPPHARSYWSSKKGFVLRAC